MLSSIFQPCEIQVNMIQNVVFLRPPQRPTLDHENRTNQLPPLSNDELVRGVIHLHVPSARHIDGLRVHLRATMSLAHFDAGFHNLPTSWESNTFLERVLEIGVPERLSALSTQRSRSQSTSRARSPSIVPGGGGRHHDQGHDIFRHMVRGVSRGRTPHRAGSQTPQSGFMWRGSSVSEDTRSRGASVVRTPREGSDSESSTPGRGSVGQLSEEDLQHVAQRLEQHTSLEDDAPRGRSMHPARSPAGEVGTPTPHVEVLRHGGEDGLELSKGVHTFEFAFIVPADAPPYDRSPFGKVRYTVKVVALGAGRALSNVEEWRDFFPMVNPSADGGATPLSVLYNDVHPTVGMLSVACTSNNISVGGLFNVDIHSPSPPPDLIVYMVRVSLYTTIEVHTRRKGKQVTPVQKRRLFEKGHVGTPDRAAADADTCAGYLRYAGSNSAWTVQGVARIPDDNAIRPSTMPGTRSPLRFHHTLVVEVVHSRSDPRVPDCLTSEGRRKLKVFTLRQSVVIPSCCCALDAVTLPTYSARIEDTPSMPHLKHLKGTTWEQIVQANQDRGDSHNMCVCGLSLADLSAAEQAMLPPVDPTDAMIGQTIAGRKVGELTLDNTSGASSPHGYAPTPGPSRAPASGASPSVSARASPAPSPGMHAHASPAPSPLWNAQPSDAPPAYAL